MRNAVTGLFVIAIWGACLAVGAGIARDASRQGTGVIAATGTGVLSGVVMTVSDNPRPVHRATVRVTAAAGVSSRIVGTDELGKFMIEGLPPGTFTVQATKPGYVAAFHGAKRPGRGPGVPVAIAEGQRVEVALSMLPGGAISGLITTPGGNPAPEIQVVAVDVRRTAGAVPVTGRGVTDDRGVYRIFGLPPGDYLVAAIPRLVSTGEGRGTSVATGVAQVTDAEVQWARAATTGISRAAAPGSGPSAASRLVAYAPVLYPGVTDASGAATVSIGAGDERTDVGLMLRIAPMAKIAGTMVDHNGQPVTTATLALYPPRTMASTAADALVASGALGLSRATISPGAFSFPGVAPGRYTLVARTGGGRRGAEPANAPQTLWSITELTVDGGDQTGIALRLVPGLSVTGSIAFERSSVAPPADLTKMVLTLLQTGSTIGAFTTPRAMVEAGGTFRFTSVVPGPYSLNAITDGLANGAGWTLKSAMLNGRDLADGAFDLKPGADVEGLALTFTDRAGAIAGRLVDTEGRPVTRYSVVVFTVERSLWLPNARRIKLAQPATDGSFSVGGLPAGDYAIVAAENVEDADVGDPAFLSPLLAVAYKVTVAEGETRRQDLTVGSR